MGVKSLFLFQAPRQLFIICSTEMWKSLVILSRVTGKRMVKDFNVTWAQNSKKNRDAKMINQLVRGGCHTYQDSLTVPYHK